MHRQVRGKPAQLVVDQAVQGGTKIREAKLVPRKNSEAYVLDLTSDILAAVDWHIAQGYAGPQFLFTKTGSFARSIDSHKQPLTLVQQKLGLRVLSHHKVGRHSVASQAVTGGGSVKAVQAQLGHRSEQSTHHYAHLGSGAQRQLMEALKPLHALHEATRAGNVTSRQPGVNGRFESPTSGGSRQRGVNGRRGHLGSSGLSA